MHTKFGTEMDHKHAYTLYVYEITNMTTVWNFEVMINLTWVQFYFKVYILTH
jgi:hypothetical protein